MAQQSKRKIVAGSGIFTRAFGKIGDSSSLASWLSRDWLWGLILVVAVVLVYTPVWQAGFIWDDDVVVTANPSIVGPLGLKEIWTTARAAYYPLTQTTVWVEHALWGLAPLPYHLVNVALHATCAVLLWRVLRSLQVPGAWLGAALWALHPLQVDSAAWVAEMKNTQSCLFYLPTILFFVRWLKARDLERKTDNNWNYGLMLLFAALAMMSKTSTMVLPAVLCLCAWWIEGRWQWRNLLRVGPVLLMSVAAGALSMAWSQNVQRGGDLPWVRSWPERVAAAGDVIWFYLGKLVWPHPLMASYPTWNIDAGQPVSYLPLLAVIVILVVLWLKRETWSRPWFFGSAYYLAVLLPGMGLVTISSPDHSLVSDHMQYLAGMGPLALAAAGLIRLADFVIPNKPGLQGSFFAGVLLILGIVSWQRTCVYQNTETLWTDTLAKNPNDWVGHNNFGLVLIDKGELDEAIAEYEKAIEIKPDYGEAHYNLGLALFDKGEADKAIIEYQKALEINPDNVDAHNNLGDALLQKGGADQAIIEYQKALEIDPNHAKSYYNLGIVLSQKGEVDEAMGQFEKALEINPDYAEAHNYLGVILFQKAEVDEAMGQFEKALEINPNYAEAHNNLGAAHLQKGEANEAITEFQEVLRLNPSDSGAKNNLAKAEAMARQAPGSK